MAYRVTNPRGLRMRDVKVANEGAVISEEYYNAHHKEYDWSASVERVNKSEVEAERRTSKRAKAGKDEATPDMKSDTPGAVEHVGQQANMSDPTQGGETT